MRQRRSMAAVLACALALTGCGAGTKAPGPTRHPAVPRGFTRTTAGPVSFAYPAGWRRGTAPPGSSAVLQRAQGRVVYAQASVLTKVPQVADPEIVGTDAYSAVLVNATNVNRGPFRPIKVSGAMKAVRLDYTFQSTGSQAAARGTDVSVVYGGRKALVLRVSGLRTALPDATVEQIVRSVEIPG